jgi:isoleucyl-tRNA synthetase
VLYAERVNGMMKQVQSGYNPKELEKEVQEYWAENDIYKKVKDSKANYPDFYFVDGPPYTTGAIHLGTALNKTIKDVIIRYKRMGRHNVRDQPGYDMHGLPIEVKVEKSIGVKSKGEIEEYGIDKFVSTCKQFALDFQKSMTEQFKELGIWMDWDQPYMTLNPGYIEGAWWTLKRAYDRDMLTSAERVLSWCPRCETALAEAEIEYSDEKDPSIYVRFKLKDQDAALLIWTTTPWTLLANMAVAVQPDFKYVKVRYLRENGDSLTLILLKDLVESIGVMAEWDEYQIIEEMTGKDLVGREYIPPFAEEVPYQSKIKGKWIHKVIPSETVEAENTGMVHIAPGHGPEDFELGLRFEIPPFCPVDEAGNYTVEAGTKYAGIFVKKANDLIMDDLENNMLLFHRTTLDHRYGHCWRCETNIIYRTTRQWFLQVTKLKELMLSEVDRVRWTPDWAGSSRQRDWVANARDWCISRQRYWGVPIPVWTCTCGEMKVISSLKELEGAEGYREDLELHRPWIDEVHIECENCGGPMSRVPDVLDVWFDAGVCSWAQLDFPKNTEKFERWWPARWIVEAHDQTRGWFYSQLASGCIAFDRAPYESVLMHGWVLDPNGERMSKSKGNTIEPRKIMDEFGADALRFYLLRANAPWEDLSFQHEGVKNARKMLNILWNIFKFAATYMSIDNFNPDSVEYRGLGGALHPEDHWMISKTERIKNEMAKYLNSYELHRACRALEDYIVEDLSRWYVRLIRDRMWKEEGDLDKLAAYKVLYDSLMTATKLLAPICPHITEEIYRHMDGTLESIHMIDWPTPDLTKVSERLEASMQSAQEVVEIIAAERQKVGMKLRWPLRRVVIRCRSEEMMRSLKTLENVIKSQANVKEVEMLAPGEEWDEMILSVIPNPHAIGKVYRQWSSKIAVLLKSRPAKQIKESVSKGEYQLGIEGQMVKIEPNMVSFSASLPPDITEVQFSEGDVYIDFMVTPEIKAEGFARELVRRIQQMRKDMKLDVEEFISTEVKASATMTEYFKDWKDHIMKETRSRKLMFTDKPEGEYSVDWKVEGGGIHISVTSLNLKASIEDLTSIPGISQNTALALIDAGINRVEELRNRDEDYLEGIKGVSSSDLKRILEFLEVGSHEGEKCSNCGALVSSEDEKCSACGATLKEEEGAPMEEIVEYLMSIPQVSEELAVNIYQAGYDSVKKIKGAEIDDLKKLGAGDLAGEIISYSPKVKLKKEEPAKEPKATPEGDGVKELVLEGGFTYLIKEERTKHSYELFQKALNEGIKGFCVTRNYPLKIKSKYDLGDTPMIWLSSIGKENSLRPKDLEKLSFALDQFVSLEGGIILMDGLEYLITNNNFLTVLRFIQSLRDQIAINNSILLLALNPSTLEASELNLLEKEVDTTI